MATNCTGRSKIKNEQAGYRGTVCTRVYQSCAQEESNTAITGSARARPSLFIITTKPADPSFYAVILTTYLSSSPCPVEALNPDTYQTQGCTSQNPTSLFHRPSILNSTSPRRNKSF
jgi:hypothetical protein